MVLVPHDHDVLLGRGTTINTHPGNQRLRSFVSKKKEIYSKAETKKIKRDIAISIVQEIQSLSPPGRFLIDSSGGQNGAEAKCWVVVEQEKAIEKVLHRLREKDRPSGGGSEKNGAKKPNRRASRRASCSSMTSIASSQRCLSEESLTASVVASGGQFNVPRNRFNGDNPAQIMQQPLTVDGSSHVFQSSDANNRQNLQQMGHVQGCDSVGSSFIPAVAPSASNIGLHSMAHQPSHQSLHWIQSTFGFNETHNLMSGNDMGNSFMMAQTLEHNANASNIHPNNSMNVQSQQFVSQQQVGYNYDEDSADKINAKKCFLAQQFQPNAQNAPSENNGNFHFKQLSSSQKPDQYSQNQQIGVNSPSNGQTCDPIQNNQSDQFLLQASQHNSSDIRMEQQHHASNNSQSFYIGNNSQENYSRSFTCVQSQGNFQSSCSSAQSQDHFTNSFGGASSQNGASALYMGTKTKSGGLHGGVQTITNYPDTTNEPPRFINRSGGVDVHANEVMSKSTNDQSTLCVEIAAKSGSRYGISQEMNHAKMPDSTSPFNNEALSLDVHTNQQQSARTEINGETTSLDTHNINWKDPFAVEHVSEGKQFHESDYQVDTQPLNLDEEDDELECDLRDLFARKFKDPSERSLLEPLEQISLRQWIEESKRNIHDGAGTDSEFSASNTSVYVKNALPIALKLADRLASDEEAYRKGIQSNILPKAISTDCVVVNLYPHNQLCSFHDSHEIPMTGHDITQDFDWDMLSEEKEPSQSDSKTDENVTTIERRIANVDIISRQGVDATTGSKDFRLFSLGVTLFELFSRGNILFRNDWPNHHDNALADSINNESAEVVKHPTPGIPKFKKFNRKSISDGTFLHESIAKLLILGVPPALCALVGDLLVCQKGELRGEDTYKSFADVREDLQLMIDEPSRFLDCTEVGPDHSFKFGNKLYGREKDIHTVKQAYLQTSRGTCNGVLILGEAGVGKSALASYAEELTAHANGYFFRGQFHKNFTTKPLFIVGNVFNQICDAFAENIHTNHDKQRLSTLLQNSLGIQAHILRGILPSLSKLMPLKSYETPNNFVDIARSLRFLFFTLLQTLSSHFAVSITISFDDMQWADDASLLLISSILHDIVGSKHVFFVICCRDDDINDEKNIHLAQWIAAVSASHLKKIVLCNLNAEQCKKFVSDTLCLSPRLVCLLSSVLFSKTLGNPFFVRKMLESLKDEGCLHFSLKGTRRRWVWDLDKILDLDIADNVVALLTRKLDKLPSDMQQGLQAAACMGSSVDNSVAEVLSSQLGFNLCTILQQAMQKGYMDQFGSKFRFVHDKVHQAVYEMMPEKQRREKHMTFGLFLSSQALNNSDDDMLFIAVNQINQGGPGAVSNHLQKTMIATLNMNVGTKAVSLSDFASALDYFKNGILFLNQNHWENQYALSNELFGAAAEAACEINDPQLVMSFSDQLLSNSKSLEDRLNAMYIVVKSFRRAMLFQESKKFASNMLELLGEELPRPMGDSQLISDVRRMHGVISELSDDSFLSLKRTHDKKQNFIMKAYHELLLLLHSVAPNLMFSVCLRIVQISLTVGITESSPVAFAHFAVLLLEIGDPAQAHRLGSLALRLAKELNVSGQSSMIIGIVQQYIAWTSEPLQSIAESHLFGYNAGMQAGDVSSSLLNYNFFVATSFYSGKHLDVVRKISGDFIQELVRQKQKWFVNSTALIHLQALALIEGPDVDASVYTEHVPSFHEINSTAAQGNRTNLTKHNGIYQLMRAFYFRQYDQMSCAVNILDDVAKKSFTPLKINFLFGIFYEGLVSFCMARRTKEESWAVKGRNSLSFMKKWQASSSWNFENKALLLEAELMSFQGDHDQASELYLNSIKSAKDHKFIHEEGIAYELAGYFYHDRGFDADALQSFNQAIRCYKAWGAKAMSKRLEDHIQSTFDVSQSLPAPTQVKAFIKNSLAADALAIQVANIGMSPSPLEGQTKRPHDSD